MTTAAAIVGIVPGLQATALVAENLKHIKMDLKPSKKIDIKPKPLLRSRNLKTKKERPTGLLLSESVLRGLRPWHWRWPGRES